MKLKTKIKNVINYYIQQSAEVNAQINANNISAALLHQKTFPQFKNYCQGKKLVVCGAGPTLKKYQPVEGAVHIALNRAFLYEKAAFDFIFAQDFDGINKVQEELRSYRPNECVKLLGKQAGGTERKEIPESFAIQCNALRFYTDLYIYHNGFKSKFVSEIETKPLGNMPNVGLSVMQFALYMNPSELYIVGNDLSGGHFVNKNMSSEEISAQEKELQTFFQNDLARLLDKWKELKRFAQIYYPDTKIISVNPVCLKGIFEDWNQE